jgi:hypothetical protein
MAGKTAQASKAPQPGRYSSPARLTTHRDWPARYSCPLRQTTEPEKLWIVAYRLLDSDVQRSNYESAEAYKDKKNKATDAGRKLLDGVRLCLSCRTSVWARQEESQLMPLTAGAQKLKFAR